MYTAGEADPYEPPHLAPRVLKRDGYPDSLFSRAFLDGALRTWVQVAPLMRTKDQDPEVFGKALDSIVTSESKDFHWSDMIAQQLMPIFVEGGKAVKKQLAQEIAERALLEALIMHADSGSFPTSIDQIPGHWIDPFNDQPLHLKLMKGGIRIYSVGPDRKDDGGLTAAELKSDTAKDVVAAFPPVKPSPAPSRPVSHGSGD